MLLDRTTLRNALAKHLRAPLESLPPARRVTFMSHQVEPGVAFVALAGARHHGIEFADEALARGAPFILSDRPHPHALLVDDAAAALLSLGRYARQQLALPVVGITGSAGKTTTKALLAAALNAPASPGNFNTPFALATVLIDAASAAEAPTALVLELGVDAPGDMHVLTTLVQPTAALLTLIAPAHLQALGNLTQVAAEKSALLRAAHGARWASKQAHGWLPADLQAHVRSYRVKTAHGWSSEPTCGHHANHLDHETLRCWADGDPIEVPLPGIGRAFAENALGALMLAQALGINGHTAAARISGARLEPGRLQRSILGPLTLIDDSYNANPASLSEALSILQRTPGERHAVLGAMLELGPESARYHRELGARCAASGLTSLITVGRDARPLAEEAVAAGAPLIDHFDDVEALLAAGTQPPRHGTLLVKGSRGIALERLLRAWRSAAQEPT